MQLNDLGKEVELLDKILEFGEVTYDDNDSILQIINLLDNASQSTAHPYIAVAAAILANYT